MDQDRLALWVEEARAGDEAAFERVVAATWVSMVALARVVLAEHHRDAEDVVQEAFCQAWLALPKLRSSAAFPAWLRRITVREAGRWRRRQHRPGDLLMSVQESLSEAPNQKDGDVAKALARLPRQQRAVLFLSEIEGLTDTEVAASLGIRRSTVRVHRQRARNRLRRLLEGEFKHA